MIKAIWKNKKTIISGMLILAWMSLAFAFSDQAGKESGKTSGYFTDKIVKIIMKIKPNVDIKTIRSEVEFLVRKTAHFSVYFVGGIIVFSFLNTFPIRLRSVILLTIILGSLYAVSDEMHQLFIAERTGQARDVLIDSLGVIIATFFMGIRGRNKEEKWKN